MRTDLERCRRSPPPQQNLKNVHSNAHTPLPSLAELSAYAPPGPYGSVALPPLKSFYPTAAKAEQVVADAVRSGPLLTPPPTSSSGLHSPPASAPPQKTGWTVVNPPNGNVESDVPTATVSKSANRHQEVSRTDATTNRDLPSNGAWSHDTGPVQPAAFAGAPARQQRAENRRSSEGGSAAKRPRLVSPPPSASFHEAAYPSSTTPASVRTPPGSSSGYTYTTQPLPQSQPVKSSCSSYAPQRPIATPRAQKGSRTRVRISSPPHPPNMMGPPSSPRPPPSLAGRPVDAALSAAMGAQSVRPSPYQTNGNAHHTTAAPSRPVEATQPTTQVSGTEQSDFPYSDACPRCRDANLEAIQLATSLNNRGSLNHAQYEAHAMEFLRRYKDANTRAAVMSKNCPDCKRSPEDIEAEKTEPSPFDIIMETCIPEISAETKRKSPFPERQNDETSTNKTRKVTPEAPAPAVVAQESETNTTDRRRPWSEAESIFDLGAR